LYRVCDIVFVIWFWETGLGKGEDRLCAGKGCKELVIFPDLE